MHANVVHRLITLTLLRMLAAVLLIDRRRGKPRHIVNSDAIKALLDAYEVPYTHLVDFRGTFEQQVRYQGDSRQVVTGNDSTTVS